MKIYVCVKHAADSAAMIRDPGGERIEEHDLFSINPYDEHAVEAAVELGARTEDAEVVALTVGGSEASATLERALAMGAERGLHVVTERSLDSLLTARGLAAAIRRDGEGDLVLTGNRSVDSQGSQVPFRLAACLGWPAATDVASLVHEPGVLQVSPLDPPKGTLTVECEREAGARQVLKVPLPCVVGVSKALNKPRNPTLRQLLKARRKPVETLPWDSLEIGSPGAGTEILELRPAIGRRRKEILEGNPEEAVAELVRRLREEARVL